MRARLSEHGTSYVEVLAATVLLGFSIVMSAGIVARAHHHHTRLEQKARAMEAVASELSRLRALGDAIPGLGTHPWVGNPRESSGLPSATGAVHISPGPLPSLVQVEVSLQIEAGPSYRRIVLLPSNGQ